MRIAVRRLAAAPGFTGVAVLVIAVAIAANASVFLLVDAVFLRPFPFEDPEGLLQLWTVHERGETPYVKAGLAEEWRGLPDTLAAVEPYEYRAPTLIGFGEPDIVPAAVVSGGLMPALGVRPLLGRTLQPADVLPDSAPVVVIAEALWRGRFGGDPAVVGRRVKLDGEWYEIVGVMPKRFRFPRSHQIWIPLRPTPYGSRPALQQVIVRLQPGVNVTAAEQRLDGAAFAAGADSRSRSSTHVRLRPFGDDPAAAPQRRALLVLFGSVGLVLLISCANIAGLMLVRGSARERELAVRAALGASRAQLLGPLAAEATLLSVMAALLGAAGAVWVSAAIFRFSPLDLIRLAHGGLATSWRAVAFTALLALLTAVIVGLFPGWRASHLEPAEVLKAGAASSGTRRQQRLRETIVVVELALSVVLLVGAVLLARTFVALTRVDPGFDTERILTVDLTIQQWKYRTPEARQRFFDAVQERLRRLPGVQRVALAAGAPPGGGYSPGFEIATDDGRVTTEGETPLWFSFVDPDYFAALGLPLRDGRTFTPDEGAGRADAIVISEAFARRLWPNGRAVGRRLRMHDEDTWHAVVGVAADVLQLDYSRPRAGMAAYFPLSDAVPLARTLVVRADGDPALQAQPVRAVIRALDAEQPILEVATAEDVYASFFGAPRFYAYVMSVFAALALLLAAVGLYGVMSYAVAHRAREFGIRLALGAAPAQLRGGVLQRGLWLVSAGTATGFAISLLATRLLETQLVGIHRLDVATYGMVLILAAAMALAACWAPAHRASRTDPAVTLRADA